MVSHLSLFLESVNGPWYTFYDLEGEPYRWFCYLPEPLREKLDLIEGTWYDADCTVFTDNTKWPEKRIMRATFTQSPNPDNDAEMEELGNAIGTDSDSSPAEWTEAIQRYFTNGDSK